MRYNESLKEFGRRIKEEGIDYKTIVITPSLLPKFENENQDILDFLREYADRIKWDHFMLKVWLEKYNYFKEFRDYYDKEEI